MLKWDDWYPQHMPSIFVPNSSRSGDESFVAVACAGKETHVSWGDGLPWENIWKKSRGHTTQVVFGWRFYSGRLFFFYDISYVHDISLVNLVQRRGMRSDFNDNLGGDFRISIWYILYHFVNFRNGPCPCFRIFQLQCDSIYKRWSDDVLGEAIVQQKVVWDRLGDLQPRCILKLRHIFPTPTWFQRKQSSWSQHTSQFLRPPHSWLPLLCSPQVHPQFVGAYISSGFRVNGLPKHFLEKKALHKIKFDKFCYLHGLAPCWNQCFLHVVFWSHPRYWLVWWPLCTQRGVARRPQTQNGPVCQQKMACWMPSRMNYLCQYIYLYIYMYICVQ